MINLEFYINKLFITETLNDRILNLYHNSICKHGKYDKLMGIPIYLISNYLYLHAPTKIIISFYSFDFV